MTASMDALIAAEMRGRFKCKACDVLDNLAPEDAAKWLAWASDPKTSSSSAARVLSNWIDGDKLSHSVVERHLEGKHGAHA